MHPILAPLLLPTHDSHTFTWWKNWIAMRNKWLTGFGWSYESIRVSLCSTRLDGCVACRSREARERLMFIPTCQFHYKRNCCFALCSKGTTTTTTNVIHQVTKRKRICTLRRIGGNGHKHTHSIAGTCMWPFEVVLRTV